MMIGLLLLLLVVLSSCSLGGEDAIRHSDSLIHVGDSLPEFTIRMSDGTVLMTSDLYGKPSLLVFFSTTCPDCQHELPGLNERYERHGQDTVFVGIACDQSDEEVADYWTACDFHLPYSAQPDRSVYSLFAKRGIPRVYISDPRGVVCASLP